MDRAEISRISRHTVWKWGCNRSRQTILRIARHPEQYDTGYRGDHIHHSGPEHRNEQVTIGERARLEVWPEDGTSRGSVPHAAQHRRGRSVSCHQLSDLLRWMKVPEFDAAYRAGKRAAYGQAVARLRQAMPLAVQTMLKVLVDRPRCGSMPQR